MEEMEVIAEERLRQLTYERLDAKKWE